MNFSKKTTVAGIQQLQLLHGEIGLPQHSPEFAGDSGTADKIDCCTTIFQPVIQQRVKVKTMDAAIGEKFHDFHLIAANSPWFIYHHIVFARDKFTIRRRCHHGGQAIANNAKYHQAKNTQQDFQRLQAARAFFSHGVAPENQRSGIIPAACLHGETPLKCVPCRLAPDLLRAFVKRESTP